MWDRFLEIIRGDIRRLDSVIRFNSIPVINQESVSAHSFWVTFYSLLLDQHFRPGVSGDITRSRLLSTAIMHDISECLTGDVVRTFKYSSSEFKNAVNAAEDAMARKYFPQQILELLNSDSGEDERYVTSIVKAADFISLYMFMNREWIRGNRELRPFIDRMVKDLESMAQSSVKSDHAVDQQLSWLYLRMSEQAFIEPESRQV